MLLASSFVVADSGDVRDPCLPLPPPLYRCTATSIDRLFIAGWGHGSAFWWVRGWADGRRDKSGGG